MRDGDASSWTVRRQLAIWNPIVTLLLWLLLYGGYAVIVAPVYAYLDMGWVKHDSTILLLNLITVLVSSVFLPRKISRPSYFVIWMLFLLIAVGVSFVPLVSGRLHGMAAWSVTGLACGAILSVNFLCSAPIRPMPKIRVTPRAYFQALVIVVFAVNAAVFISTGFSLDMPGLGDVYDARLAFRSVIDSLPFYVGYAMPLAASIMNPLMLLVAAHLHRYWMIVVVVIFQMALYSVDGQKMVLFMPVAVLGVYYLVRFRAALTARLLIFLVTVVVGIASLLAVTGAGLVVFEVVVRRLFLIPPQLLGGYYDYFGRFGFAYLQHSRFFNSGFLTPEPGYLIGRYMFGSSVQNANASFISDGFANFGLLGVAVAAIICGLLLRLIDSFTSGAPRAVVIGAMVSTVIVLANSPLQTALLTGGLLGLLAALYFLPDDWSSAQTPRESIMRAKRAHNAHAGVGIGARGSGK